MKVLGIIAEYNPFHNGHRYHLEESKRITDADFSVAVMSGDFTQRGTPAIIDKWTRAEIAVRNGVDLVLELPFAFACNNAEYFAQGAMGILEGIGCVTHFSFGSEHGELRELIEAARLLSFENEEFKKKLKEGMNEGLSFPKARCEAFRKITNDKTAELLLKPNNILAIEYLKQWHMTKSKMNPITIKRIGAGYNDEEIGGGKFASATGVRNLMNEKKPISITVPIETSEAIRQMPGQVFLGEADLYELLVYKILTTEREELSGILSAGEGLENKLKDAVKKSRNIDELIKSIKSKRYTETRICRLLAHTLIDLQKTDFLRMTDDKLNYARVLAISGNGELLLRRVKKENSNTIPIITNINRELTKEDELWKLLKYDIKASDVCNLLRTGEIYSRSDHVMSPYRKTQKPTEKLLVNALE